MAAPQRHLKIRASPKAAIGELIVRRKSTPMDFMDDYLQRAKEIIGDRTPGEERYDREVVRWLRKGKDIKKAIAKANEKFPTEALAPEVTMYDDT